jgi:hypothetical protein
MSGVLDHALVGLALLVSAGYAMASLGPRSLRRRMLAALSRMTARAPTWLKLGRIAQRFAIAADGKAQGACGGCGTCGSEPAADRNEPAAEVRVPLEKIRRRV